MRIFPFILIYIFSIQALSQPICGTFKVQVYVPEKNKGNEVYANPGVVSSTKLILNKAIPKDYWGRVIEIETTFKNLCLLSCDVADYKIIKAVSPFEKIQTFNHDKNGLVKKMKCERIE